MGLLGPRRDASLIFLKLVYMKMSVFIPLCDRRQYSGVLKDPMNAFVGVLVCADVQIKVNLISEFSTKPAWTSST